jgi:hypothetical protein
MERMQKKFYRTHRVYQQLNVEICKKVEETVNNNEVKLEMQARQKDEQKDKVIDNMTFQW